MIMEEMMNSLDKVRVEKKRGEMVRSGGMTGAVNKEIKGRHETMRREERKGEW